MSRNESEANLRANSSQGSGEIRIHIELGETYRPYTEINRIAKTDYFASQSQNSILHDQDLTNDSIAGPLSLAISTDFTQFLAAPVQHQNLFLPSADDTPLNGYTHSLPLDSPNSPTISYSLGGGIHFESGKAYRPYTEINRISKTDYFASQSQNSILHYQDLTNDSIAGPLGLATSIDFTQFLAAPVQHQNLFLPSADDTPLNGYTHSLPLDSPDSPTTSSSAGNIMSYDTHDDAISIAQSTSIHQDSSTTDAIYPTDNYQNSQYLDLNLSGTNSYPAQWPVDQ